MRNIIITILALSFFSCKKQTAEQNLDITVTGQVVDQNNNGFQNATILVSRGKGGLFVNPTYEKYDSVKTNVQGMFNYVVKKDEYTYQICCAIPSGYNGVTGNCLKVQLEVSNGVAVNPPALVFKLIP
jgi:hypothetical protein